MDDELLDIVDGFDEVIGTVNRKDYDTFLKEKRGYIRAVDLFILNDEGKLWIPVRTAHKTIAPNGYDYSAGGHVGAGDDYLESIIRETEEETNVTLTASDIEFVAKVKSTSTRYISCFYLLRSNQTPEFNPHDFVSAEWMDPADIVRSVEAGHPAKSNLCDKIEILQIYLSGR